MQPEILRPEIMRPVEAINVVQTDSNALRNQLEKIEESQRNVFRLIIAGVAAVFVIKTNEAVNLFLPVLPILAMTIIALGLAEAAIVYRYGRWLARNEQKINAIAKNDVLGYENWLCSWRTSRILWFEKYFPYAAVAGFVVHFGSVWLLITGRMSYTVQALIWVAAFVSYFAALYCGVWVIRDARYGWIDARLGELPTPSRSSPRRTVDTADMAT